MSFRKPNGDMVVVIKQIDGAAGVTNLSKCRRNLSISNLKNVIRKI